VNVPPAGTFCPAVIDEMTGGVFVPTFPPYMPATE